MRSLQGKILLVYLSLAALAIGLSLLAWLELRLITGKISIGDRVAEFFDTTLEVRRFEKNHFLYRQPWDLRENQRYVQRALDLLRAHRQAFGSLVGAARAARLEHDLVRYARLMASYADRPDDEALATEIRALGKDIVTTGETLAARERRQLQEALAGHQRNLLFSVAGVVGLLILAGILLARGVSRPLRAMEASMEAVAQGQLTRLDLAFRERELASLSLAFNRVLDELEHRQHTLVRAEKLASLGTLLSGVAHELNNPLSNISSSAQILKEDLIPPAAQTTDLPHLDPFHVQLIADIDQETQRAAAIVRSLLDYARDRDFQCRPVALGELVEETLRFLKNQKPPGVDVKLAIPADLVVAADRPRLQQALLNLIKNALEAMGDYGELAIAARRLRVGRDRETVAAGACRPGTAAVELSIADSGPGIPPQVLPRIFDPFYTTKPVGHGNGLGLFIVHEIIDEHGGSIVAENIAAATATEEGMPSCAGARFRVLLPTAPTHPDPSEP